MHSLQGGFYIIEAKDLDEAIGWAAKIPSTKGGSIESLSHKADISGVSMFCIPSFDEMTDLTPYLNHVIPAHAGIQTVSHSANQVEGTSETGSIEVRPIMEFH